MNDSVRNLQGWKPAYLALAQRITNGDLRPGDRLPTLRKLSHEMGITVHSARQVMARLKKEGCIDSWQGYGHRVAERRAIYNFNREETRDCLTRCTAADLTSQICRTRVTRLQPTTARQIELSAGTMVVETEILRFVDNKPVALSSNYIPVRQIEGVNEVTSDNALGKCRVDRINPGISQVHVRLPTPNERVKLDIPSNQPVMITFAKSIDQHSNTIIAELTMWRGDCITIEI